MMSRNDLLRVVGLVGLLTLVTGCLNLNKSYPEKRLFVLDVSPTPRAATSNSPVVLKINKFRVSPLYGGRQMVYRTGDLQYESDFYDEWFISPSSLLTQQFHSWFSKSGQFQYVLMGTNHLEPTHLVEGKVSEFYGDYRASSSPKAILGIDLQVVEGLRREHIVFQRTYHREVSLSDRSPDTLAGGLTEALPLVLVEFEKELSQMDLRPQQ